MEFIKRLYISRRRMLVLCTSTNSFKNFLNLQTLKVNHIYGKLLSTSAAFYCPRQLTPPPLQNVSELIDYANKQIFLSRPNEPEDTTTTPELLSGCASLDDILNLIGDMHHSNKLWNEEFIMYMHALSQHIDSYDHDLDCKEDLLQLILNNENFQVFLQKMMVASIYLKSTELAWLLWTIGKLEIPEQSFVVKHILISIQKRINDFFPKDVSICYAALRKYENMTPEMKAVHAALLMHLENMAKDEEFFVAVTAERNLKTFFSLARFAGRIGSPDLRRCLVQTCVASFKLRRKLNEPLNAKLAITVLHYLSYYLYHNKFLVETAMKTIQENKNTLTDVEKKHLAKATRGLRYMNDWDHQQLLKITET
ncbi:uncharacterized protein LOC143461706 [Clavelina lepadiformis]|uniref:uncharacterized protein LOC143461706 n=1 Tax=Clavelina lepadiformis TaxID=159417 RepID=UPI004041F707